MSLYRAWRGLCCPYIVQLVQVREKNGMHEQFAGLCVGKWFKMKLPINDTESPGIVWYGGRGSSGFLSCIAKARKRADCVSFALERPHKRGFTWQTTNHKPQIQLRKIVQKPKLTRCSTVASANNGLKVPQLMSCTSRAISSRVLPVTACSKVQGATHAKFTQNLLETHSLRGENRVLRVPGDKVVGGGENHMGEAE